MLCYITFNVAAATSCRCFCLARKNFWNSQNEKPRLFKEYSCYTLKVNTKFNHAPLPYSHRHIFAIRCDAFGRCDRALKTMTAQLLVQTSECITYINIITILAVCLLTKKNRSSLITSQSAFV